MIKGDATKTIPKFVKENPYLIIALLYLDFDIYEPTKVALEHLLQLVPKGGIVGLDEINLDVVKTGFWRCRFEEKPVTKKKYYKPKGKSGSQKLLDKIIGN